MNPKFIMLTVAGLCGLGAFYGTTRLIRKESAKVVMQAVVVAARDLKVEEVAKAETLKVVQMEKSVVPAGAFASAVDIEGRWVQVPLLEGEPVIERKLAPKGSPPGMVSRIPKGMRAYAIDVTEQTGVSGFILPDHRVDVVHSVMKAGGQNEATPILQDVLVLASGTTFTRPDDRAIQSKTVTLAVTPGQVDVLVAARAMGTLSLALRGLNDHSSVALKPKPVPPPEVATVITLKAPEPVKPPPPPPPAPVVPPPPPARYVHVYRGIDLPHQRVQIDGHGEPGRPGVEARVMGPDEPPAAAEDVKGQEVGPPAPGPRPSDPGRSGG